MFESGGKLNNSYMTYQTLGKTETETGLVTTALQASSSQCSLTPTRLFDCSVINTFYDLRL